MVLHVNDVMLSHGIHVLWNTPCGTCTFLVYTLAIFQERRPWPWGFYSLFSVLGHLYIHGRNHIWYYNAGFRPPWYSQESIDARLLVVHVVYLLNGWLSCLHFIGVIFRFLVFESYKLN